MFDLYCTLLLLFSPTVDMTGLSLEDSDDDTPPNTPAKKISFPSPKKKQRLSLKILASTPMPAEIHSMDVDIADRKRPYNSDADNQSNNKKEAKELHWEEEITFHNNTTNTETAQPSTDNNNDNNADAGQETNENESANNRNENGNGNNHGNENVELDYDGFILENGDERDDSLMDEESDEKEDSLPSGLGLDNFSSDEEFFDE